MFTISDSAASKAREILEAEGKPEWGLRIFVSGGGCCGPAYGMDLDERPNTGDNVTEKNGLKVFTDSETFGKLQGMEIDFIDDGQQQGFVIKATGGAAPKSGGCGCSGGSCH